MRLWLTAVASPRAIQRTARAAEAAGWHGLLAVDSQNLSGDPYVALAMAATVTSRLGLGTGVTNSVTRHAAATACAIVSVQRIAEGRAVLGIGRGDSALAHLGRAPARLGQFERYLRQLQSYLRGEAVPFAEIDIPLEAAPPLAELDLADAPAASRIQWLPAGPKVPVEVAASGARVIAIAALHADRIMFTLGADPDRLAWGIDHAKQVRRDAGLDPEGIVFGAYVNCACHSDVAVARRVVRGGLTVYARFQVMHGKTSAPFSAGDRAVLDALHDAYDMRSHTRADSQQAAVLTDDFIDRFAVVGTPETVIARLQSLAGLGLDKLAISGGTRGVEDGDAAAARTLLEREVLPAFAG
jgi:5,10-methylenetetrahydromethanopterin reductase